MSSEHANYFLKGVGDAFNWSRVVHLVTTSKSVQHTLLKSLALNGVAYLGILVILETFYNTPDHHLFGYSYTDLTGYPLYLICLVFNSKFYTQIAQGRKNTDESLDIMSSISTVILYGNFALFIAALRFIPYVGSAISFLVYSIIMSYYCFEYKWINLDWTVEQRMAYAEQHWAYYLGFGLPAAIITFFLSTLRAGGVFALVYPSYIMMASEATPVGNTSFKLGVFIAIRYINQCIMSGIRYLSGSKGVMETQKDNLGKLV